MKKIALQWHRDQPIWCYPAIKVSMADRLSNDDKPTHLNPPMTCFHIHSNYFIEIA